MKILVIGAGMMGWAAAFDMARTPQVEAVTLADSNSRRLNEAVARIDKLTGNHKVTGVQVDAADTSAVREIMRGHDGVLSAVPYFFNLELAKAAIEAGVPLRRSRRQQHGGEAGICAARPSAKPQAWRLLPIAVCRRGWHPSWEANCCAALAARPTR